MERAFTLVELMVTLAVLGVLISISIPTFMRAMWQADERGVQSDLRVAAKAAFVYSVRHGEFGATADELTELGEIEPALTFVDGATPSTQGSVISVAEDLGGLELALAAASADGDCFYLRLSQVTQEMRHADTPAECRAADYLDGPNSGW
ncbi:MAG: type II secretion system protein [Actinobacteria bacterium]|nr:type II secretion system protein [Actinomycetota bacterium]